MELLYTFPAVIGLGALHSLEPGHGKGIITAYLISSGAKIKEAVMIGLIAALAHTLSITLLAVSASTAINVFMPEKLIHWLQFFSGIVVIYIGLNIITQRLFEHYEGEKVQDNTLHAHCCHDHCAHNHDRHKGGAAVPASRLNLFMTGFFTGILPCPSALAILLAAVSANKIPLGLGLVAAFSIGGAITMVTIALLVVRASHRIQKLERWQVVNRLALVSSCLIIFLGGAVIFHSLSQLGVTAF